jgi:PHD/YefM family antitoxin component YafN of YafNO toxin-antitoxin module
MVKPAARGQRVCRIRRRRGSAALMSDEDYEENLMETLGLLAIPGFRASIKRSVAHMKRDETLPLEAVLQAKE